MYGFTETGFFNALRDANVDTFCDIRDRRGMRGAKYAFVNSVRLQKTLSEIGIRYVHRKDLAPSKETRGRQAAADRSGGTLKRARTTLSQAFITAYETECLAKFNARTFVSELPKDAKIVALFCVEKAPTACHRSLVANKLKDDLDLEVQHLPVR